MKTVRKLLQSENGSVMLEFVLVLPIYLLLFGGTFLTFDLAMSRLHLQESNRNLAWLQNDRFDTDGKINKALYDRVTGFYDDRNTLESGLAAGRMWGFGEAYDKYVDKEKKTNPDFWGHKIGKYELGDSKVSADNDWCSLYSGNMELNMRKLSGVYMGAVAVSSVIFPNDDVSPLYNSAYSLTRSVDDKGKIKDGNGEMLLVRRTGPDTREDIKTLNDLVFQNILFRSWPSSGGALDTFRTFLGI